MWSTGTWKDSHYCWLLEKCKSKLQWGITSTLARMTIIKSLQIMNAREGMEKREPSYIVSGDVSWYSHYRKQYRGSLRKQKIELPYDPAIPLLGIYPEKMKILTWEDICTPMFMCTCVLWKQPKRPLTGEWVKNKWCIYVMEYYTVIKSIKCHHLQQHWCPWRSSY